MAHDHAEIELTSKLAALDLADDRGLRSSLAQQLHAAAQPGGSDQDAG